MSLLKTIRKDQLVARKNNDKQRALLLTTLIGEASMFGINDGKRESTDHEVIVTIKKFIKGATELVEKAEYLSVTHKNGLDEISILESYLPKQMSEDELSNVISGYITDMNITDMKGMGSVMSKLRENHESEYDGKLASGIVRKLLS